MNTQNQSSTAPSEATPADASGAAPSGNSQEGAAAVASQEHGTMPPAEGDDAAPVGVKDAIASLDEKPATDGEPVLTDAERDALLSKERTAAADAFERKVADKQIELDRIQPEGAQVVKIRAGVNSHRLGLVIRRKNGDYTAEQLGHRAQPEITLEPGDQLLIAPLGTDSLREFLRMADMTPGEKDTDAGAEGEVAASPGGTA